MKLIKNILNALILSATLNAAAEIREAGTMKEALKGVKQTDVVVFDIDNTVVQPLQTLGSDQWFEHLVKTYTNEGYEAKRAVDMAIHDWLPVQKVTKVELVERYTAKLIAELQNRGVTVLALTARPEELEAATFRQLSSVGVQFRKILFSFGKNKGVVLREYLNQVDIHPARLIFVDDKLKNVNNMDAEFSKDDFLNINFRYGAADIKVHAFSAEIAKIEWQYFVDNGLLLSDEEAERILSDYRYDGE